MRVADVIGMTDRTIHRARSGHVGAKLRMRLQAALAGEVFDAAREERIELYSRRYDAGLSVFDGTPARDAVSVYQLAVEAEVDGPE